MSALRLRSAPSMSLRISGSADMGKGEERMGRSRLVQQSKRRSLAPPLRLHHLHRKSMPLVQSAQSGTFDYGDVYEYVFPSIVGDREAKSLVGVEPFHGTFDLDGGRGIGAIAAFGGRT